MTLGDLERWMRSREGARVVIRCGQDGAADVSITCGYFSVSVMSRQGVSQALDNALADLQEQQNEFDSRPVTEKIKRIS